MNPSARNAGVAIAVTLSLGMSVGLAVGAGEDDVAKQRSSPLDEQLLQSVDTPRQGNSSMPDPIEVMRIRAGASSRLEQDSTVGELALEADDTAAADSEIRLQRIGQQMRLAQHRIAEKDTSVATRRLQQQVVDDLTGLIRQLERRCQEAGEGQTPAQAAPGSGPLVASPGPAGDRSSRPDQPAATPRGLEMARQLNRRTWGQLPAAMRQTMFSGGFESFLPKYEALIEHYFERLAEEVQEP